MEAATQQDPPQTQRTSISRTKLAKRLDDIEKSLREVNATDRQPLVNAHNKISALRDELGIGADDEE